VGHRRSIWGSLNLRFPFTSRLLLGFLTWLRLVLRVPTFFVTTGEVSTGDTGDPVAGDLARCSRVVFSQICSSLSGFYPSEASTEVVGQWGPLRSHCRRRIFQSLESRRSSSFRFFPTQKRRLKCFRAKFVCFITPCGCCPVILLR